MPLDPGTRLGPYEILAAIGAGGMGEVYRARDTRLGRDVALKVLASHRLADPDGLARFERESRIVAGLTHENIVSLFDVGTQGSVHYLVSELLEGETLRGRVQRGPLPWRKAVDIGSAVAAGLAAAHARQIVHRDIKPENIFLTTDGRVKVLDFGVAGLDPRLEEIEPGTVPTATGRTSVGLVVGTVGYMSPEQVRGERVDARSDIFSLGAVLFEMLSAQRTFARGTPVETLTAILNDEPDWSMLPPGVPPELVSILRRCLEKHAAERFQSAGDLAFALRTLVSGSTTSLAPAVRPAASGRRALVGLAAMAALAAAGAVLATWTRAPNPGPAPAEGPEIVRLTKHGRADSVAISPDGRYVAYTAATDGVRVLRLRHVQTGADIEVQRSDERQTVFGPTFSRDGSYLFFTDGWGRAHRIPALGGVSHEVFKDVAAPLSVSPDGRQVAFFRHTSEIERPGLIVAAADGSEERLLQAGCTPGPRPHFALDGRELACPRLAETGGGYRLVAIDIETERSRDLTPVTWDRISAAVWLPAGRGLLLLARQGDEWSQLWHVPPAGAPRRLSQSLSEMSFLDVASDGDTAVAIATDEQASMWIGSADGREWTRISADGGHDDGFRGAAWTPDGRIVYASSAGGSIQLWSMDTNGRNRRQLTTTYRNWAPAISPDGQSVVYISSKGGETTNLRRMDMDGSNARPLTVDRYANWPAWSPDGKWIVFLTQVERDARRTDGKEFAIARVPAHGGPVTMVSDSMSGRPVLSPDGQWISAIYDDPADRRVQPVVAPFPAGEPLRLLSVDARQSGRWSPDGRSLFIVRDRDGVDNLWRLPLDGSPATQITTFDSGKIAAVDVARDGRVLCVRSSRTSDAVLITGLNAATAR